MGQLRRLLSHAGEQSCQPVQVHLVAQSNTERRQRVLSIVMVGSSVKITNCGPLPPAPSPKVGEGERVNVEAGLQADRLYNVSSTRLRAVWSVEDAVRGVDAMRPAAPCRACCLLAPLRHPVHVRLARPSRGCAA